MYRKLAKLSFILLLALSVRTVWGEEEWETDEFWQNKIIEYRQKSARLRIMSLPARDATILETYAAILPNYKTYVTILSDKSTRDYLNTLDRDRLTDIQRKYYDDTIWYLMCADSVVRVLKDITIDSGGVPTWSTGYDAKGYGFSYSYRHGDGDILYGLVTALNSAYRSGISVNTDEYYKTVRAFKGAME
jgi:hypothetical protein